MSAYGTQIFYCRTYDNNNIYDVIHKLSPYFYKETNEITQVNVAKKIEIEEKLEIKKEMPEKSNKPSNRLFDKQDYITPTHKDCLFWSLYIAKYGYNDYMQIQVNYGVKKMEVNQKVIDYLKTRLYKMKGVNTRITKARVQEMFSDMMINQKDTPMINVYGLLCYYEFNIIMLDETNKTFIRLLTDEPEDKPTYLLSRDGYRTYSIVIEPLTNNKINEIEETFVELENFEKPMKAISNYKTEDLERYVEKLGLSRGQGKMKKTDMFNMVWEHMKW